MVAVIPIDDPILTQLSHLFHSSRYVLYWLMRQKKRQSGSRERGKEAKEGIGRKN